MLPRPQLAAGAMRGERTASAAVVSARGRPGVFPGEFAARKLRLQPSARPRKHVPFDALLLACEGDERSLERPNRVVELLARVDVRQLGRRVLLSGLSFLVSRRLRLPARAGRHPALVLSFDLPTIPEPWPLFPDFVWQALGASSAAARPRMVRARLHLAWTAATDHGGNWQQARHHGLPPRRALWEGDGQRSPVHGLGGWRRCSPPRASGNASPLAAVKRSRIGGG